MMDYLRAQLARVLFWFASKVAPKSATNDDLPDADPKSKPPVTPQDGPGPFRPK